MSYHGHREHGYGRRWGEGNRHDWGWGGLWLMASTLAGTSMSYSYVGPCVVGIFSTWRENRLTHKAVVKLCPSSFNLASPSSSSVFNLPSWVFRTLNCARALSMCPSSFNLTSPFIFFQRFNLPSWEV